MELPTFKPIEANEKDLLDYDKEIVLKLKESPYYLEHPAVRDGMVLRFFWACFKTL